MSWGMPWCRQIGVNSTWKAFGSDRESGLTPPFQKECHARQDDATKSKTQELKKQGIQDRFVADAYGFDAIGCHAKLDQYGRRICRLGHGSAWALGRRAFLERTDDVTVFGVMEYCQKVPIRAF
jgi:hypothetical protein